MVLKNQFVITKMLQLKEIKDRSQQKPSILFRYVQITFRRKDIIKCYNIKWLKKYIISLLA